MRSRVFGRLMLFLILGAAIVDNGARTVAQTRTARLYSGTLVQPRATRDDTGHVVISMEAQGDLRGVMTFELDPTSEGSTYQGKWALAVAYLQDLNADGTNAADVPRHEDDAEHDRDHPRENVRFVREGTIFGSVAGLMLLTAADGAIDGIASAQIEVAHGTLAFKAAAGAGAVARPSLDSRVTTLSLTF